MLPSTSKFNPNALPSLDFDRDAVNGSDEFRHAWSFRLRRESEIVPGKSQRCGKEHTTPSTEDQAAFAACNKTLVSMQTIMGNPGCATNV
jgi:hypothetical protein